MNKSDRTNRVYREEVRESVVVRKHRKQIPLIEQLILVHYINVGNLSMDDMKLFIEKIMHKMRPEPEEQCKSYFVPIRNGDSRVECINPKLIGEDEFKKAKDALDKAQKAFTIAITEIKLKEKGKIKFDVADLNQNEFSFFSKILKKLKFKKST